MQNTKSLNDCVDVDEMGTFDGYEDAIITVRNYEDSCQLQGIRKFGGKKRKFDLMDCADRKPLNDYYLDGISL